MGKEYNKKYIVYGFEGKLDSNRADVILTFNTMSITLNNKCVGVVFADGDWVSSFNNLKYDRCLYRWILEDGINNEIIEDIQHIFNFRYDFGYKMTVDNIKDVPLYWTVENEVKDRIFIKELKYLYISKNSMWLVSDLSDNSRDSTSIDVTKCFTEKLGIDLEKVCYTSEQDCRNIDFRYILEVVEARNELLRLNAEAKKVVEDKKTYFFCTKCNKSYTRDKYAGFIMAGNYCKDCMNADIRLQREYKDSCKAGYYS